MDFNTLFMMLCISALVAIASVAITFYLTTKDEQFTKPKSSNGLTKEKELIIKMFDNLKDLIDTLAEENEILRSELRDLEKEFNHQEDRLLDIVDELDSVIYDTIELREDLNEIITVEEKPATRTVKLKK